MEALHTALGEAGRDPAIRAVILTGRGRAFCAGADLRDDLDPEATMRAANRVVETIRAVDVPVIAAVNGPAVGYGAALAAAADLAVVVANSTRYGGAGYNNGNGKLAIDKLPALDRPYWTPARRKVLLAVVAVIVFFVLAESVPKTFEGTVGMSVGSPLL